MTISELRRCRALDRDIETKLEQLNALEDLVLKTSVVNNGEFRQRNYSDSIGQIMPKIIDLRCEINCQIDELCDLREMAITEINKILNSVYRQLLTYRYIRNKKWSVIAERMGYEQSYIVHDLHKKALMEFEKTNKIQ